MSNPYSISFGKEPMEVIPRSIQIDEIIHTFCNEHPFNQTYMISGVRGSGKTVFLTEIGEELSKRKEWIVVELNPKRDLLTELTAALSSNTKLAQLFKSAKINLSFFGMGLEITGEVPITDIEIDEITSTKTIREFTAAFQILIRKNLPVYLLMTGLYENIYELQNQKSLTFLYRAPKIKLHPLNMGAIAANYAKVFHFNTNQSMKMAALTKGYSFAFQVLGYLTWQNNGDYLEIQDEYKQYLEESVYEKYGLSFLLMTGKL